MAFLIPAIAVLIVLVGLFVAFLFAKDKGDPGR
jgi:hypothetical protein